jgi:hypothetical protein
LLLNPAGRVNPVEHIEFILWNKQWYARPRNGSVFGAWTINVCNLNAQDLLELRLKHIESVVVGAARDLNDAIAGGDVRQLSTALSRATAMFRPTCEYVGLTYYALRHYVPDATLATVGLTWPMPKDIGV